jgi:hypothetical protein
LKLEGDIGNFKMSKFPISSTLQDLERDPYDLLPYPVGFADDDEATRADSFDQLVLFLEQGIVPWLMVVSKLLKPRILKKKNS